MNFLLKVIGKPASQRPNVMKTIVVECLAELHSYRKTESIAFSNSGQSPAFSRLLQVDF